MAAHRRPRSEARHGDLARRSPRHDRARRQGAGSTRRVPGRHHDLAFGYAAPEADSSAAACRSAVWSGPAGRPRTQPSVAAARMAMVGETEDEYRRLLYVAMTRAADRLIIGGCLPGNMNSVRKSSLVRSDRQRSRQFRIAAAGDRSTQRRGEALLAAARMSPKPPALPRRRPRARQPSCRRGCLRPLRAKSAPRACFVLRAPPMTKANGSEPANRSSSARRPCSAARWCTACCNRLPDVAADRRRDAAQKYVARNTKAGPKRTARPWRQACWP